MARKLDPDETLAFAEKLTDAALRAEQEWSLETLGDRRDAVLSMSPELRAFFNKDARELAFEL